MVEKLAAISVDLDEIPCYAAIHGLEDTLSLGSRAAPPASTLGEEARHAVYRRCLPRFARLFARASVPATFFAIGQDLAAPDNAQRLRKLADAGHEIGNHSQHHFYDLTRRPREEQRREIRSAAAAITQAVGVPPVGFRAPGYTVTDELLALLVEEGTLYDASVFPCPPYYLAKALALAGMRLRGRRSRSVLDHPRVLTAPREPYRIGAPYTRRGSGLLEIPNGVTPAWSLALPYIGTSLVLAGALGARTLTRLVARRRFVSLELHGIDLADATRDGLEPLAEFQPDLRRTAEAKEQALASALELLHAQGFRFVTLREAALELARES